MSRWFRHYAGMMRDEKLVAAAMRSKQTVERVVWIWGAILESAAEINDGGRYDLDTAEAAYFLRAEQADVDCVIQCLHELGRLREDRVAKWSDRQYQSDVSTDRVRSHRERQRNDTNQPGNRGTNRRNVSVTDVKRFSNAPETETETETDTDTDTEKEKKDCSLRSRSLEISRETSNWPPDYREQFWNAYPRKKAKKAAFKALDAIRRRGEVPFDRLMAGILKIPIGEPVFIKHPATWLHGGCWDDEQLPGETNGRAFQQAGNVIAAADRLVERIAQFERPDGNTGVRSIEGETNVRLLSSG